MELEQTVHKKKLMEKEIFDFINKRFIEFYDNTNLYPNNINLNMLEITEIGNKTSHVITSCEINIEI